MKDTYIIPEDNIVDMYAGIRVKDHKTAFAWYEQLLGAPPTYAASEEEVVWDLAEHRSLFVIRDPEHAGHSIQTIFLSDLDTFADKAASRGITPTKRETYENGARRFAYHDPEGNEIGFGGMPLSNDTQSFGTDKSLSREKL